MEDETFNSNCRYCNKKKEDIFHILASCEYLSASLYLPVRHDEVGRVLYNALIRKDNPSEEYVLPSQEVWLSNNIEIWWDTPVKTTPMVKHNRPDIVLWKKDVNKCFIIDVCIPLDENVKTKEKTKLDRYVALSVGLNRIYPTYSYSVILIVLGATGLISNSLVKYVNELGFEKKEVRSLITNMQTKALIGSMRIMKSAMLMKS